MKRAADHVDDGQRVRIGLTGLAFVFVLVLLAAVFARATNEEPITANSIDPGVSETPTSVGAPPAAKDEPKEPLAELGVAPGNADTNEASKQPGAGGK